MSNAAPTPNEHLLASFPPSTRTEWRSIAEAEIGTAAFETLISPTEEGIDRQPIYWPEDIAQLTAPASLPGESPFLRGFHATHPADGPWLICQSVLADEPTKANELAHNAIERGATAVSFVIETPGTLDRVLAGIDCSAVALSLNCRWEQAPHLAAELSDLVGDQLPHVRGTLGTALYGVTMVVFEPTWQAITQTTAWAIQHAPYMATIFADGSAYYDAGAHAVKELGLALASAVVQIRTLDKHGLTPSQTIPHVHFSFALGNQLFIDIAKLRAARLLWAQIAHAFGVDPATVAVPIHARSAIRGHSEQEPHTNLIRGTTAAFAAMLGGATSIEIMPFDGRIGTPTTDSLRLALNTQHLLREESQLGHVIDPAGGSWYIEQLTDQVARAAWAYFQELEQNMKTRGL